MSLQLLWTAAVGGNEDARRALCEALRTTSVGHARRLGAGQWSDDVAQEVVASVLRQMHHVECPKSDDAFVHYRTRSVLSKLRKQSTRYRQPPEDLPPDADRGPKPPDAVSERERAVAVRDCLRSLSQPAREVVRMKYAQGKAVVEIAKACGVSDVTIYKRIKSALSSLLTCLRSKGVEP